MFDSDDDISINFSERSYLAAANEIGILNVRDNDYMKGILIKFDDLNTIVINFVNENANNAARKHRSKHVQAQFKRPTTLSTPGAQKQI